MTRAIRWMVGAVALLAFAEPAIAQDQPINQGKAPASKAAAPKAPVAKAPAAKAPAAKAPEAKAVAPKAPKAPAPKAAAPNIPAPKTARVPKAAAPKAPAPEAKAPKEPKAVLVTEPVADENGPFATPPPDEGAVAPPENAGTEPQPETRVVKHPVPDSFRRALEPYGTWTEIAEYGQMWVPAASQVGAEFAPYLTHGHWGVTDDGQWAWVSDLDWKLPFHYGRWAFTRQAGWAWQPGEEHAPAWVVWRLGEPGTDYVGWAPMPPDREGAEAGAAVLPFYFVESAHLFHNTLGAHVVSDPDVARNIHQHSSVFSGHYSHGVGGPGAPLPVQGAAPGAKPASPTFDEARVPSFAQPRTRLRKVKRALAPQPAASTTGAETGYRRQETRYNCRVIGSSKRPKWHCD